jgi:hypothetical protein
MLAETFEDVRMKLIVEKVRHNPVEMASHAEGSGWEFYGTTAGKTKFWGTSSSLRVQSKYMCSISQKLKRAHREKSGNYSPWYQSCSDRVGPLPMVSHC